MSVKEEAAAGFLPLKDDGLLTFLANKMPQAERECRNCIFISTGLKLLYFPIKLSKVINSLSCLIHDVAFTSECDVFSTKWQSRHAVA